MKRVLDVFRGRLMLSTVALVGLSGCDAVSLEQQSA